MEALGFRVVVRDEFGSAIGLIGPEDSTIVCRCEEVTAGDVRGYAKLGCLGPNQTKAFGRAGMGPCQGRYCGLTVTALLAEATGRSPDETGYYRIRPGVTWPFRQPSQSVHQGGTPLIKPPCASERPLFDGCSKNSFGNFVWVQGPRRDVPSLRP